MPNFDVTVEELRNVRITYTVDADTPEEAIEKAETGETLYENEDGMQLLGVTQRLVDENSVTLSPE